MPRPSSAGATTWSTAGTPRSSGQPRGATRATRTRGPLRAPRRAGGRFKGALRSLKAGASAPRRAGRRLDHRRRCPPRGQHLDVTEQEGPLVQTLATQPPRHLVVALARVARAARRHDVLERVPAAARDRQHAVLLERAHCRAAVGARAPRLQERLPLLDAQVVVGRGDATGTPARRSSPSGLTHRHAATLPSPDGRSRRHTVEQRDATRPGGPEAHRRTGGRTHNAHDPAVSNTKPCRRPARVR